MTLAVHGVVPVVSAEVVAGKKTNRIKKTRRDSTETSPQRGLVRYRKDKTVQNLGFVKICASMPPADLDELDAVCERATMSRSQLIRQAVKYFAAYLDAPADHHRAVHEPADLERIAREVRALRAELAELADAVRGSR